MDKHRHYLLLLMVIMFGFQDLANALQTCPETTRDSTPFEIHEDLDRTDKNCHDSSDAETGIIENCDARHCCAGATSSIVFPSGHSIVNPGRALVSSLNHAYIYSRLRDIFHPPKLFL